MAVSFNQFGLLCFVVFVSGCTSVAPWQRGNLASAQMQWETNQMQAAFDRHVYFSKEASSGGTKKSIGGGCGCN